MANKILHYKSCTKFNVPHGVAFPMFARRYAIKDSVLWAAYIETVYVKVGRVKPTGGVRMHPIWVI